MKKIFISFLAFSSVLLLMLSSCKKDETKEFTSLGSAGTLSASTTAPTLTKETSANTAVTFTWPATVVTGNYGTITYTLQIDKKGNNFKSPREIAGTELSTPVTEATLNTALLNLGLPDGVETQIEVRLRSSIAPNVDPVYSNTVTLTVTPYSLISYLYMPGSYQGWDPAATSAFFVTSATSNGVYDGTVTFTGTDAILFKFTPNKNWDVDYGGKSGVLALKGDNFNVTPGTYKIHVDTNAMTYTIEKQ